MGKRVVLTTFGSLGDLHPFIAVAKALQRRGMEPVLAGIDLYRHKAEAEGITYREVRPSEQMLAEADLTVGDFATLIAKSPHVLIERAITPYLDVAYADACEVMAGADLAITSSFAFAGRIAAEKLGISTATLLLSPAAFFSAEDPPYLFELPWLPRFRQLLGVRATRAFLDFGRVLARRATRKISDFRRRVGAPALSGDEIMDGALRADRIFALYSPHLAPLPADAPTQSRIAGFAFYDSEAGGQTILAPELEAFFARGLPPLVFSLGSTGVHAPGKFYEQAAEVARRLGRRALLLVGQEAAANSSQLSSDDVLVAGYAPHSKVFPRAAAIVHHGGSGTVGQAMRAGKPQLVCPMFADQADNAERLVRLGLARRLDHRRFTAPMAVSALGDLLADSAVVSRAAAISAGVAAENGAQYVADEIAAMLEFD